MQQRLFNIAYYDQKNNRYVIETTGSKIIVYATGQRALYKITRISDQKRIATLEVSENHISQARVVNNKDLPLDLQAFIKHYETEVLQ